VCTASGVPEARGRMLGSTGLGPPVYIPCMTKTSRWVLLLSLAAFGGGCGSDDSEDDADVAAMIPNGGSSNASSASAVPGLAAANAGGATASGANATASGANASGAGNALPASDPRTAPDDVQAPPDDATVSASGLASKVLQPGMGTLHPTPVDTVSVQYSGWTPNGKLFDSSYNRGTPAEFPLNRVILGWTEGLQLMVEGEIRRFWIPSELAYGDNPTGNRPAGALTFDVELLEIVGSR
jgi:FKBP-type peptidyl-prolyl cis-trans isomerase